MEKHFLNSEKGEVLKRFNVKGCDIVWHKSKGATYGKTIGKGIEIFGNDKPKLAWVLAHELAHALEQDDKKASGTGKKFPGGGGEKRIEFDDVQSGRHSFGGEHYYPVMSPEEFHASRRSMNYLKLACGVLGISVENAVLSDPPEELKKWWDRGYFYQWRVQIDAKKKLKHKKTMRQESAKARFLRQQPIISDLINLSNQK